jgi:DNA-binding winged helix-turn-helix (wHTH) protein/tetratricopeptide (TPR) repeat protein
MNFIDRTFLPRIDLAREVDFAVGALQVRPSRREIEADGATLVLQKRVMQVLVALAHPSAEVVSQDELISRCWGGLAVGEDAVGRCIGQLRKIATQWPGPPFEIVTISGVGYRLAPAAGPPAAAAPTAPADSTRKPGGPKTVETFMVAGAVVVLTAIGLWLWASHGFGSGARTAPSRIAILPFDPVSSSPGEKAFATGLADELQGVLSMGPAPVVPREDAVNLRGASQAKLEQLGVRLLLDGTVSTSGDTLQARVHLDDPGKHVTLWSMELSGPATSPDALEAQVGARAIAVLNCAGQALRLEGGLADSEALALYLHACDVLETRVWGDDPQAVFSTLDALRQVASRARDFAPGHSVLARFLAGYRQGVALQDEPQVAAEAEREARKALTIDPKDADAFVALSLLRPEGDYAGREKLLNQALAANPTSAYANLEKSNLLLDVGRVAEAVTSLERAAAANPLSLNFATDLILADNAQTAAANAALERLQRLWPNSAQIWWNKVEIYGAERRWDELLATLDDRHARPKSFSDLDVEVIRAGAVAQKTRTPSDIAKTRRLLLAPPHVPEQLMGWAGILADLGLNDDAFVLVDRWSRTPLTAFNSPRYLFNASGANLRRDARFMSLAAKIGLLDYWRSTGKWPDFCAQPGLPYDCKAEAAKLASKPG